MASSSSIKKSKKDDVEALLSDLDNLDPTHGTSITETAQPASKADDAQTLLDDLDDLVKRRASTPKRSLLSTPSGTPARMTASTKRDNVPLNTMTSTSAGDSTPTMAADSKESSNEVNVTLQDSEIPEQKSAIASPSEAPSGQQQQQQQPSWGNWWNSATKLADQARAELEKRAAQVQSQVVETTKEVTEGGGIASAANTGVPWAIAQNVNSFLKNNRDLNKLKSDFSKVGMKGWNDLLNVVVPPIEKHEILSITLSHGE
jgi:hypothetical protein